MNDATSDDPDATPQPTDTAAPASPLTTLRGRAGRRLAVLSLLGAVMVALPLVQVLRYQNAEELALIAERAGLDPVTRAVDVQRGLLAHRDVSTLVLRGRNSHEPERKVRQGEVDDRVGALAVTLVSGQWQRAVQESDALRDDWALLTRQIDARTVSADESEQAHRLLVEQTLQVIDIVADAMGPHARAPAASPLGWTLPLNIDDSDNGAGRVRAALTAAHALPRLAWQIALLLPSDDGDGDGNGNAGTPAKTRDDLAVAEAGMARTLGALNAALERHPRPTLAAAGAAAGVAADSYFQALHNSAGAAELRSRAAAALRAQFDLFQDAQDEAANGLRAQIEAAQTQRSQWLSAMGVLAALWLAVLLSAVRTLRLPVAPPPGSSATPISAALAPASYERGEAQRLLQRLGGGSQRKVADAPAITSDSANSASADSAARRAQPQPTQPGAV